MARPRGRPLLNGVTRRTIIFKSMARYDLVDGWYISTFGSTPRRYHIFSPGSAATTGWLPVFEGSSDKLMDAVDKAYEVMKARGIGGQAEG